MQISYLEKFGKPLYEVEFRPDSGGDEGAYYLDGTRLKRVSTVVKKFPDTKEGLIQWSKQRVALTAGRLLRDRVVKHPKTGVEYCYFRAEEIALIIDAAYQNPDDIKDQTAEVGTAVHAFIEEWLTAGATEEKRLEIIRNYCLPPHPELLEILQAQTDTKHMTDAERNLFYFKMKSYMFHKFVTFWLKSGLTYVGSEIIVGSRKYGFGGRIDILARDRKGRLVLVDFKTSKHVGPSYFAQVAGYKLAYEEMYGEKIYKVAILQSPREWTIKNQGFGVYPFSHVKYRAIFLFILKYWKETEFKAANCRKDYLP